MDFFREQDIARRNTRLLVILFAIAVSTLILLTNLLVAGTLFYQEFRQPGQVDDVLSAAHWRLFLGIGAAIAAIIGTVVLVNWLRFTQGGRTVAEALGGRPAVTSDNDPLVRQALNIVAEMALAANMPVPPLYILDEERGINAFAAGITPADAVVAVTRGALVHLTRDELQGVIAHEFSHILNGDMRLSIRLAAMLRGITFVGDVGSLLIHSNALRAPRRSSNDSRAGAVVLGLGLYLLGLLGGLMAGLIKSAISKQKEYLADASSVQFTRNPDGIGNALKVIGGYTPGTLVHAARAEELSHLFFGQVKHRMWMMFATHPPLAERIRRIDPQWDGQYVERPLNHAALEPARFQQQARDEAVRIATVAGLAGAPPIDLDAPVAPTPTGGEAQAAESLVTAETAALPAVMIEHTREPLSAMALVLALLWHDTEAQQKQVAALAGAAIRGLETLVSQFGRDLGGLKASHRLTVIELCLPALKQISPEQYQQLKRLLLAFVRADGQIRLEEWCLYQLIRHYLDPEFVQVKLARPRHASLQAVAPSLAIVLGTVAMHGDGETTTAFKRGAAVLALNLSLPEVDRLGVAAFSKAVGVIADCYPLLKVTILKALATTAAHDGVVNGQELMLIKAIAAVIDCPVPNHMLDEIIH